MWNESWTTDKQNSNVNSRAHERQIMLFVLERHLEQKHEHQMHSLGQLCFAPEAWNHAQLSRYLVRAAGLPCIIELWRW